MCRIIAILSSLFCFYMELQLIVLWLSSRPFVYDAPDKILWRTGLLVTVVDIADPAADTDFRKPNRLHITAHSADNAVKCLTVIVLFVPQTQDGNAITNAFVHQMFGTIARWMWAIYIAGLVMCTLMSVDKALKFWRRSGKIGSYNNGVATTIPNRHTGCNFGTPSAAFNKMDRFPKVIDAEWRGNNWKRFIFRFGLSDGDTGKEDAHSEPDDRYTTLKCGALFRHRKINPSSSSLSLYDTRRPRLRPWTVLRKKFAIIEGIRICLTKGNHPLPL